MTYDDHRTAAPRRSPQRPPNRSQLGGVVGFLVGLAVAVTPVAVHIENHLLRVTLMVVGGVIWLLAAVVLMTGTGRGAR